MIYRCHSHWLLRVAVRYSVSGAVNHGSNGRKTRYGYQSFALLVCLSILSAAVSSARSEEGVGFSATKPSKGPYVETERGYMVPYRKTIPGTAVSFEMVPVPGGTFRMRIQKAGENVPVAKFAESFGRHRESPKVLATSTTGKLDIVTLKIKHCFSLDFLNSLAVWALAPVPPAIIGASAQTANSKWRCPSKLR